MNHMYYSHTEANRLQYSRVWFARKGIHPVSMTEFAYGIESSKEFPWILEGLVRANMLRDSWFGTFRTMHDSVRSMSLPETSARTDQYLVIRPNQISSRLSLVLAEIRVDGPLQGTQAFREYEIFMIFLPYRMTRSRLLQQFFWSWIVPKENVW